MHTHAHSASIEKYLLEKSRIISQAPGERNYHVFYYLLQGADSELHKQLALLELDQYHYLTQGSSISLPNSAEEYHRLRQSLTLLGFSVDTQMRCVGACLGILSSGGLHRRLVHVMFCITVGCIYMCYCGLYVHV